MEQDIDELTKAAILQELITMHANLLLDEDNPDNNGRTKRDSYDMEMADLAVNMGNTAYDLGISLKEAKWLMKNHNREIAQNSIMELFAFTDLLGNTMNMTIKYLRSAEKINAKLIRSVFLSEE